MENRDIRTRPAKGPVKVKSGDFDPQGVAGPIVDDRPPHVEGSTDPSNPGAPQTNEPQS